MLRTDVEDARYAAVKNVDLQQTVDDFTACWVDQVKLGVDTGLVTLHLVKCGEGKPTAMEESSDVALDDPSLSLDNSGVTGTAWLRAYVARPAGAAAAAGVPQGALHAHVSCEPRALLTALRPSQHRASPCRRRSLGTLGSSTSSPQRSGGRNVARPAGSALSPSTRASARLCRRRARCPQPLPAACLETFWMRLSGH